MGRKTRLVELKLNSFTQAIKSAGVGKGACPGTKNKPAPERRWGEGEGDRETAKVFAVRQSRSWDTGKI